MRRSTDARGNGTGGGRRSTRASATAAGSTARLLLAGALAFLAAASTPGTAFAQDGAGGAADPKVNAKGPVKTGKVWAGPLASAVAAFESGDWASCVSFAGQVPEGHEDRARALYLTGEAELMRNDAAAALTAFRGAAALRKDSVPVLVGLARALTRTGATGATGDEAEKTLRRAVTLDAKDVSARRSLGELFAARGELGAARKELESALKLAPADGTTVRSLVEVLIAAAAEKQATLDTARQVAAAYAKAAPDAPMAWFLAGLVADRQGEDEDAIRHYEKAIATDDRFLDAHKNLAILCMARNPLYQDTARLSKCLDHFERYFALGGKDAVLEEQYRTLLQFVVRDDGDGKEKGKDGDGKGEPRIDIPGSGAPKR